MAKKSIFLAVTLILVSVLFLFGDNFLEARISGSQNKNEKVFIAKKNKENVPLVYNFLDKSENRNKNIYKLENEKNNCLEIINDFKKEDLMNISGIGNVMSDRIIESGYYFKNRTDLEKVAGIGLATSKKIEDYVCSKEQNLILAVNNNENNLVENKQFEQEKNNTKTENNTKIDLADSNNQTDIRLTKNNLILLIDIIEKKLISDLESKIINNNEKEKDNDVSLENENNLIEIKIDINKASAKELEGLIGIGPAYANRIIENRPFCSIDDLVKVSGIGEATINNIKNQGMAVALNENDCVNDVNNKNADNLLEGLEKDIQILRSDIRELKNDLNEEKREKKELENRIKKAKRERDKCIFSEQININMATKEELMTVTGVGESLSEKIILERELFDFYIINDISAISGIGETVVKRFIDLGFCSWSDDIFNNQGNENMDNNCENDNCPVADKHQNIENYNCETGDSYCGYEKNVCANENCENDNQKDSENNHKENLLKDIYFDYLLDWEWDGSNSRIEKEAENKITLIPIGSHNRLSQKIEGIKDVKYYGYAWAKSENGTKIRIGIRRDGHNQYGDYVELFNQEWKKIEFKRKSINGDDDAFIISILESDAKERNPIKIKNPFLGIMIENE